MPPSPTMFRGWLRVLIRILLELLGLIAADPELREEEKKP